MKQSNTLRKICGMLLAVLLMLPCITFPSYAEGSISVVYNPKIDGLQASEFKLYKVGGFTHDSEGKSKLTLDAAFAGKGTTVDTLNGIEPKKPEDPGYQQWVQDWLDASQEVASNLETYIATHTSPDPVWSGSLDPTLATAQRLGSGAYENGLYLMTGEEQRVGNRYWRPVPVLMMVLNGNVTFNMAGVTDAGESEWYNSLKIKSRPVAYKHSVTKSWVGDTEATRPKTIDVKIMYGDTQIDTVTLGSKEDGGIGSWTYTWYSTEVTMVDGQETDKKTYTSVDPDVTYDATKGIVTKGCKDIGFEGLNADNHFTYVFESAETHSWMVAEDDSDPSQKNALKYYITEVNPQDEQISNGDTEPAGESAAPAEQPVEEDFSIRNTFSKCRLRIKKNLINYLNHNDGDEAYANATVVFEVSGYIDGIDKPVYHTKVGMTFTKPGKQEILVENIPVRLSKITVKEIYSTNYNQVVPKDPNGITQTPADAVAETVMVDGKEMKVPTYTFSFENDYSGPPKYGSGVVNKYDKGNDNDYHYKPNTDTSGIYPPAQSPR